jgi:hypothetical protein
VCHTQPVEREDRSSRREMLQQEDVQQECLPRNLTCCSCYATPTQACTRSLPFVDGGACGVKKNRLCQNGQSKTSLSRLANLESLPLQFGAAVHAHDREGSKSAPRAHPRLSHLTFNESSVIVALKKATGRATCSAKQTQNP